MDYPTIRSSFIEEKLLTPWCTAQSQSQIVLLGAGLDTRPYRFKPLQINKHTIFEIDFPSVIYYKEHLMQNEKPLCKVVRLSADLIEPDWSSYLIKKGFSREIPAFWIMEGLVYYLERDSFFSLISTLAELSSEGSQIFMDVIYASDSAKSPPNGPKWAILLQKIPEKFALAGWDVQSSFVNKNKQNRNVSRRGMIFIQGIKK
ncbi:MAG: class I SAM-dependent methyltransferase [Promethearchaeota archaeon]|jgi:methyltransferase (TIGR00027 family)